MHPEPLPPSRLERYWPRAPLRRHLVAIILLATLPLATLVCWRILAEVRAEQDQIEANLARSASALAQAVESEIHASLDALGTLARSDSRPGPPPLQRLLRERPPPRRDWHSVFLLDAQGQLLFDSGNPAVGGRAAGELGQLHERVLQRGEPAVSGLVPTRTPEGQAVMLAVPLQRTGGTYVLGARVAGSAWQRLAGAASRPDRGYVLLHDAGQRLIAWTLSAEVPLGTAVHAQATATAQQPFGVQRLPGVDGRAVYAAWQQVPVAGWSVQVAVPARPIDAAHRHAILTALGASGACLLLGVLLAVVAARRIARPLQALAARGPAGLPGPVAVQEVAMLRDALKAAARRDEQARQALEEDIAQRKRVEGQLLAAHEQLQASQRQAVAARQTAEAASRAKDEFLSMLGHELRNPLGAISAAIDVLEAAPPDSPNAAEARAIIARQTRNLAHMMNDLLDVGRVIAGKILLARQPVNLAAVFERVRRTMEITREAAQHDLQLQVRDAWVDGDAVRLEQVITNLLTNAIKYTPAGGRIEVAIGVRDGQAMLEVSDSGMGIPASLLPHVFDLFVQGERTLDRRAGGLGIGLTLVRRLVELHGGTVGVESSDQGSRFTVSLPAIEAPARPDGDTLPPSRRRRVLVIEDNVDVLAALRAKLELDGHAVSTAADGIEGLGHLLRQQPEVSIVDIGLPGLTGYELARQARAAGYAGRLIALSGYGQDRDRSDALVAGFDGYLVKPVDRTQLRASLSAD